MRDVSKRRRVPKGVPSGGEFAVEHGAHGAADLKSDDMEGRAERILASDGGGRFAEYARIARTDPDFDVRDAAAMFGPTMDMIAHPDPHDPDLELEGAGLVAAMITLDPFMADDYPLERLKRGLPRHLTEALGDPWRAARLDGLKACAYAWRAPEEERRRIARGNDTAATVARESLRREEEPALTHDPKILQAAIRSGGLHAAARAALNPWLDAGTARRLAAGPTRGALARNPACPPDILDMLADRPSATRMVVAMNPNTPPATLTRLADVPECAPMVAANPSTPVDVLESLAAKYPWETGRNPNSPTSVVNDALETARHDPTVREGIVFSDNQRRIDPGVMGDIATFAEADDDPNAAVYEDIYGSMCSNPGA